MKKENQFTASLVFPVLFVAVMWLSFFIEYSFKIDLGFLGVYPRTISGFFGIITAPFVHGDLNHLLSNSLPMIVLGYLLHSSYRPVFYRVYLFGILITGFWVWIGARPSYHIGASGVIYALASFLFFSGLFRKHYRLVALSMLIVFLYGSLIWGVFPFDWKISWESHLFGGISGLLIAIHFRKEKVVIPRKYSWDYDGDDLSALENRFGEKYWENNARNTGSELESESKKTMSIQYFYKKKEPEN